MSSLTKKQIQEGYSRKIHDIDSRMFWNTYAREQQKIAERNDKLLLKIVRHEGIKFVDNLREYEEECNVSFSHLMPFEIVDRLPVNHGRYFQHDDELDLDAYINQTCNGGYTGDDFSGYIYVLLPNMKKYFYFTYSC